MRCAAQNSLIVNAMRGTSGSVGFNITSFGALLLLLGVVVCCGMAVRFLYFIGKSEAKRVGSVTKRFLKIAFDNLVRQSPM